MLVLEGLQEAGKSSLFRVIGGEYFTDDVHDLASKDAVMAISRAWIVELPELSSLGRAEVELIKAFLSRQVDRIRPPYGRAIVEMPRRCIFGGTTNRADYLKDDTGNRRFWPVGVGLVDLAALEADREQLLAEAVASWLGGAPLYLPREVRADHAEAVEERRQEDPWETEIARWLVGRAWATSAEVLGSALQIPTDRWSRSDQMRAGQVLARLGWKKRRVRVGATLEWRYEKDGGTDVPT
jgi:predicted P-loop ATPase